jgi:hypothetical protein
MEDSVVLTEEEKKVFIQYKQKSDQETFSLGSLRKQFVYAEKQILERVEKADSDLMDHIKMVAKAKGVPDGGDWVFNMETMSFSKKS